MMEAALGGDLQRVQVSVRSEGPETHSLATVLPVPPGRKQREVLMVAPVLAQLLFESKMFGVVCLVAQAWCLSARSLRSVKLQVVAPADARQSTKMISFVGKKLHGRLHLELNGDTRHKQLGSRNSNKIISMLRKKTVDALALTGHAIGDHGAEALKEALPRWKHLESLNLNYNEITPPGGLACTGFCAPTLQLLDLSFNDIGGEAVAQLAQALQNSGGSALRKLNLSRVGAEDQCIPPLCAALAQHQALEEVSLSSNGIEDNGFAAIAELMTQLPKLCTLSLDDNDTGSAGAVAVAKSISKCANLKLIELRGLPEEATDAAEEVIVDSVPAGLCPEVVVEL
eukprot:TRINITY_DN6875_c0_g1_i14.p1 TRINITY_DN6875_c0_g1~~TRINITY_DN6875_c0_g1_i14.p1  ORF type:complete len:342 (+),score=91.57 TRINITY_DN6875_c0_g1_i14:737-1762(+)